MQKEQLVKGHHDAGCLGVHLRNPESTEIVASAPVKTFKHLRGCNCAGVLKMRIRCIFLPGIMSSASCLCSRFPDTVERGHFVTQKAG